MKSRSNLENNVNGNPYGYPDAVWRLFSDPPRAGRFESGPFIAGSAATPASRSVLSLQLKTGLGRVTDARFQAYGCPCTIAVGAWLAGQAVGLPIDQLSSLNAASIRQGLEIPDQRAHCALLGEDAIKAVLAAIVADQAADPGNK